MKWCPHCERVKPRDEFYKNTENRDGLDSRCKEWKKACAKAYRRTPEGKAYVKAYNKAYQKAYRQTPEGRERHRIASKYDHYLHRYENNHRRLINYLIKKYNLKENGIVTVYPDPTPFADIFKGRV